MTAWAQRIFHETISGRRRGPGAAIARAALRAIEPGFAAAVSLRTRLYDRQTVAAHAAARPVISIGNITTGGTGKTPVVQWLASALGARDRYCAVLIRGFKRTTDGSDEAELLRRSLAAAGPQGSAVPIVANPNRAAAASELCRAWPQVEYFILDDGFQHRRLHRDFDLVLIDATHPFGFDHLLPRGLLREPPQALQRAHAILVTRSDQISPSDLTALRDRLAQIAPSVPLYLSEFSPAGWISEGDEPQSPSSSTPPAPSVAVCGIGNPAAFDASARRAGADVAKSIALDDHHRYRHADVRRLQAVARRTGARSVITTEKDWIKLAPLIAEMRMVGNIDIPTFYVLRIALRINDDSEQKLLDRMIAAAHTP